ncbi:MAG: hypothetical protein P8130_15425 [Deltaproteobacteria bacterium]
METKIISETLKDLDTGGNLDEIADTIVRSKWLKITRLIVCYLIGVAIPFIGSELLLRIFSG